MRSLWKFWGPVTVYQPREEGELLERAADLFNALGDSEEGDTTECHASVLVLQHSEYDHVVGVCVEFWLADSVANLMGWNECRQALLDARDHLRTRPIGPQ